MKPPLSLFLSPVLYNLTVAHRRGFLDVYKSEGQWCGGCETISAVGDLVFPHHGSSRVIIPV